MGANSSKRASGGQENAMSWGSTELEKEEFFYIWIIKDYSTLSRKDEILSPIFQGGPKSQHKWQLRFVPKDQGYLGISLYLVDFGDRKTSRNRTIRARYKLCFTDRRDREERRTLAAPAKNFEKNGCGSPALEILASQITPLIVEDSLTVICRVVIEGVVKEMTGSGGPVKEKKIVKVKEELQKDLGTLLQSSDFADVSINTQTKNFMAHKAILSCRSKVFAAMFANKMLESSINTVEIQDFDADIVEEMIYYMYTGNFKSLADKASKLLQIAEKYDIPGLKKNCEYSLAENLTVENAADVLVVAHFHNADALKAKVTRFINRNKKAVRKTTAFQNVAVSNPKVLVELYLSQ